MYTKHFCEAGRSKFVDSSWYESNLPNKVSKRINPQLNQEQKFMIVWLWLFGLLVMVIVIYVTSGPPLSRPTRPIMSPIQMMIPASFTANRTSSWWDGDEPCACNASVATGCISHPDSPLDGTCSRRAFAAGFEQKIVSLSLEGSLQPYEALLKRTLETVTRIYPGFYVRLYTDPEINKEILCPLLKNFPILHVCNVRRLPEPLGNISAVHAGLWNLAPMGDQQVKLLLVRDFKAEILEREVHAVQEWMSLNTTLHVMRDHPLHNFEIVSGLFDIRTDLKMLQQMKNFPVNIENVNSQQVSNGSEHKGVTEPQNIETMPMEFLANLRDEMFLQAIGNSDPGYEQAVLQVILWPNLSHDATSHDAYLCSRYEQHNRPWPTRREGKKFVGNFSYRSSADNWQITNGLECPVECRPKMNPDWSTC